MELGFLDLLAVSNVTSQLCSKKVAIKVGGDSAGVQEDMTSRMTWTVFLGEARSRAQA